MTDIDDVVRDALLAPTGVPDHVRAKQERYVGDICSGRRRRRRVYGSAVKTAAVPVILAAAVLGAVVPQLEARPPSAAAVLAAAASTASSRPAVTLAPGEYSFTQHRSLFEVSVLPPGTSAGTSPITATYTQTLDLWVDRTGSGSYVIDRGPLQFPSVADEEAWAASPTAQGWEGSYFVARESGATPRVVATDVATLPTTTGQVATLIGAGRTGTEVDNIQAGPNSTFERAAALLTNPSIGMTPALRGALYDVLSDQPGATVETGVTGGSGVRGTAVSIHDASPGTARQIIIDPGTGAPLEVDTAPPGTGPRAPGAGTSTYCAVSSCRSLHSATPALTVVALWTAPSTPVVVNAPGATTPAGATPGTQPSAGRPAQVPGSTS